ncbi:hypothetical protein ACNKHM_11510 [Shigella sonnei]
MLREFEDDGFVIVHLLAVLFSIDLRQNVKKNKQKKKGEQITLSPF